MAIHLSNFRIQGLHSRRTVELVIGDNKLVLVGDNGSGKTTIINILYYFLSRQWHRLAMYNFDIISATIDQEELTLHKDELRSAAAVYKGSAKLGHDSFYVTRRVKDFLAHTDLQELLENPGKLVYVSEELDIPYPVLLELLSHNASTFTDNGLHEMNKKLEDFITGQILYLPTYRRIEQDLKSIFPGIDKRELLRRDRYSRKHPEQYIELVEFGMEDVERRISDKMNALKDDVRSKLSTLTGSYLRDIIGGKYKSVDVQSIAELPTNAVESILARIDGDILPEQEKADLRKILAEIQQNGVIKDDQKVVAHFLIRLVELFNAQQKAETDVHRFIEVCNNYLNGKQLVFDNNEFKVFIELHSKDPRADNNLSAIQMQQLSSGEKQIVSLFSHLFLSDVKEFFVLIDEPELSLSVPWQQRFIPDIINTSYCSGLIAATHSPFIFDNELDPYTHSISEFWREL